MNMIHEYNTLFFQEQRQRQNIANFKWDLHYQLYVSWALTVSPSMKKI